MLLLGWLRRNSAASIQILLNEGGPLEEDHRALGPTWVLSRELARPSGLAGRVPVLRRCLRLRRTAQLRRRLLAFDPQLIFANTAATRAPLEFVAGIDAPVVAHIHELEMVLSVYLGAADFDVVKRRACHYVAVSEAVRTNLLANHGVQPCAIDVIRPCIGTRVGPSIEGPDRRRLCAELGLDPAARFVGAAGRLERRKGADLFIQLALETCQRAPEQPIHFLWLGGPNGGFDPRLLQYDVEKSGLGARVHFLGLKSNPLDYIGLFDVFALTSREDPYPAVVLEAAALGKPTVCFEGAGGAPEFVEDDCGYVVRYLDVGAMATRILALLDSEDLRGRMGDAARQKVRHQLDFDAVGSKFLEVIDRFRRRSP
jgi:glycosyltransferase involved in cell wall biosynthesis